MGRSKALSPLVARLVSLIREEIQSCARGEQLPSELEFAERFGVARKSIRVALDVLEADGAVKRIRGKGTFAAKGSQSNALFRPATRRIGLVAWFGFSSPGDQKGFYTRVLEGILDEASARGLEVVIAGGSADEEKAEACYRLSDDTRIDGLIVVSVTDQDLLAELARRDTPLCLIDHFSLKAKIDCVRVDSQRAAALAVEHLYRLGHRRIACLHPDRSDVNPGRLEGFRAALADHKIRFRPSLVVEADVSAEGGARAAAQLLSLAELQRPTALVAFSPEMASGAIRAITDFGLRVPEDVSVAAGGGVQAGGAGGAPELTEVNFDAGRLGRAAVERLCRRLDEPDLGPEDIVLPVELTLGRSTARRGGRA